MAEFFLTHRALRDLLEIEAYSLEAFGAPRAGRYMDDLYQTFTDIAENPDRGRLRRHRSLPFLMAPAQQHFAVYQSVLDGIVIVTVLHGRRDIEAIMDRLAPALAEELAHLQERLNQ